MQKNGSSVPPDSQEEPRVEPEKTPDAAANPRSTRRPAADRPGSFDMTAWLVEGATGMLEELRHSDLGLSEEFWVHLYAARRESLLAARALINTLLVKLEQDAQKAEESEQRRARRGGVKIDF